MLRRFLENSGSTSSTPNTSKAKKKVTLPILRAGLEMLEERKLLSATLDWANDVTTSNPAEFDINFANSATVLANGDIAVAGSFDGTVDFDPSPASAELTATGSSDAYVAFYNPDGSLSATIHLAVSEGGNANIRSVGTDSDGNIYVAGGFTGTLELTDLGGSDDLVGDGDSFLIKFNAQHEVVWAHNIGATIDKMVVSEIEDTVTIHTVGTFNTSVNFDTNESGDRILTDDDQGGFYATFDADGVDTYALGITGDGDETFNGVVVTSTATYLVGTLGSFQNGGSDAQIADSTGLVVDSAEVFEGEGNVNGVVIKLNTDGSMEDAVQVTSTNYLRLNSLATDANGNLYIAAQYGGTVDLDPSGEVETITSQGQFTNPFVLSLDGDLGFRWGYGLFTSEGEANSVTVVDNDGTPNILFGGYFNGTVDFDPAAPTVNRTGTDGDAFLWSFLADGTFVNVNAFGGEGFDNVSSVTTNADLTKIIITGAIGSNTVDIDPGTLVQNLENANSTSAFVAQLPVVATADYSVQIISSTLLEAVVVDSISRGTVRVTIGNDANASPVNTDRGDIRIFARPVGAEDDSNDVLVGQSLNQTLFIQQGATRSYNVAVTLPDDLEVDEYQLVAVVSTAGEDDELATEVSNVVVDVAEPFVDLSATLNDSRLPEGTVSGNGTRIILPLTITNNGNVPLDNPSLIDVTFVARPADAEDDSEDVVVTTYANQNVGNLRPGQSRVINAIVTLPAGLASDDYNIVAIIDADDDVEESNEDNNEAATGNSVAVTIGQVNFTATINDSRFPTAVISGNGDRIIMPVTVTNTGNITTDPATRVSIQIIARPADAVDDSEDVVITTYENQNVGNLRAGQARAFNTIFTLPAGLATDEYNIVAIVDSADDVEEVSELDNEAVSDATIDVTIGEINLTATLNETRIPAETVSGDGTRFILPVTVTNDGNVATPPAARVSVQIVVRPADAVDDSEDVLITTLENQNVGNLRAGQSRTLNAIFELPAGLDTDEYNIVAIIDSTNEVEESDEDDNEAVSDAVVDVTIGELDLTVAIDESRLPPSAIAGEATRIILPLTVTNNGNVTTPPSARVSVQIIARPDGALDDSQDVVLTTLENQVVGNLRPDQSRRINAIFTLPADLDEDDYNIVVVVDSDDDIVEGDEDNNETVSDATITVAEPFVNLTADLLETRIPADSVSGDGTRFIVPVVVSNEGNVSTDPAARVSVQIVVRPADAVDDSEDVLITTLENQNVGNLRAGQSRTLNALFTLPAGLDTDEYNIVAIIDSTDEVEESDEDDNEAVSTAVVDVTIGEIDLVPTLDEARIPASIVTGTATRVILPVTVTNTGNVSTEPAARVSVQIIARPADAVDDSEDIVLDTLTNQNVGNLRPDQSRRLNTIFNLPANLPADDYNIVVVIDSADDIEEADEDNNEVVSDAEVVVAAPFVNLTGSINDDRLAEEAVSGSTTRTVVPVTVTNTGNVALDRLDRIDIQIVARPADAVDDSGDVLVTTLENQVVGNLGAGASRNFNAIVTLPDGLETDEYVLVAIVDSSDDVEESDEDDNEAVGDSVVDVTIGERDLSVSVDDSRVPEEATTGSNTRVILPVTITNNGNLPLAPGQRVQITVTAVPANQIGGEENVDVPEFPEVPVLVLDNVSVSNLQPGQSRLVNLSFTLPLDADWVDGEDYVFEVTVDSDDDVEESDEDNNSAFTDATITVTRGGTNLTAAIDDSNVPETATSGEGSVIVVPVTVTNTSNIRVANNTTVDIRIVARTGGDDTTDIEVGSLTDQNISLLLPDASRTFAANVTLPIDLETSNDVRLVAIIDSGDDVIESNEDDNEAISGVIDVTQGINDLSGEITDTDGIVDVVEGQSTDTEFEFTLTNDGTVAIPAETTVTLSIYVRPDGAQDNSQDILVDTIEDVDVSELAAEEDLVLTVSELDLSGLETGTYSFVVVINDGQLTNADDENNEVTTQTTFDVVEVEQDLGVSVDAESETFPAEAIVEGSEESASFDIVITNTGNVDFSSEATVDVAIFARPVGAQDDQQDVLLGLLNAQNINSLAVGESTTVSSGDLDLSGLEPGEYNVVVLINEGGFDNNSMLNNEALAVSTIEVVEIEEDLAATIDVESELLPDPFIEGEEVSANFELSLTNTGNVDLDDETTFNLAVYARPVGAQDNSQDVLIAELEDQSVGAIVVGETGTINVSPDLSAVPAGEYNLVAVITEGNFDNNNDENNEAVTVGSFVVIEAVQDLSVEITEATVPQAPFVAGDAQTATVSGTLTNAGNVPTNGGNVTISLYARPVGVQDNSEDVLLEQQVDVSVDLDPQGTTNYSFEDVDLSNLDGDNEYNLVVILDDSGLDNPDTENNTAITQESFEVLLPVQDFSAEFWGETLPDPITTGDQATAEINVRITNNSNIALDQGEVVDMVVYARPVGAVDNSTDVLLGNFQDIEVDNVAMNDAITVGLQAIDLSGLEPGEYSLVVIMAEDDLTNADSDNNTVLGQDTVVVNPA